MRGKINKNQRTTSSSLAGVMKNKMIMVLSLIILLTLCSVSYVLAVDNLMALQGNVQENGLALQSGDLRVYIYDADTGGATVYDSTTDFNGNIVNGQFDVMLGSGSNELILEYGKYYYLDMAIEGQNLNFSGNDRQIFQSGVGNISNEDIDESAAIDPNKISEEWVDESGDSMFGDLNMTTGNDIILRDASIQAINADGTEKAILTTSSPGGSAVGTTIQAFGNAILSLLSYSGDIEIRSSNGGDILLQKTGGNVGIGSFAPTGPFDINNSQPRIHLMEIDTTDENFRIQVDSGDLGIGTIADSGAGYSEKLIIQQDGDVGIGTASPSAPLTVMDSGEELAIFNSTDNDGYIKAGYSASYAILGGDSGGGYIDSSIAPFRIEIANDEKLRILGSGNVGIGTTTPQNTLNVVGDLNVTGNTYLANINISGVQFNAGDVRADGIFYGNGSGLFDIPASGILEEWVDVAGDTMSGDLNMGTNDINGVGNLYANNINLSTGSSRLEIGITPASKQTFTSWLHEFGDTGGSGITQNIYYLTGYKYRRDGAGLHIELSNGKFDLRTASSGLNNSAATLTSKFLVENGGNVGIGTTSPEGILQLGDGTGTPELVIDSASASTGKITFRDNLGDDRGVIKYDHSSVPEGIKISAGGSSDFVTFTTDGNVGIGTTTPSAPLTVMDSGEELAIFNSTDNDGYIKAGYSASYAILGGDSGGAYLDASIGPFRIEVANDEKLRILNSGNVGIGDAMGTSSPAYIFHINDSTSPQLIVEDSTSGVQTRVYSNENEGMVGTRSDHPFKITAGNSVKMVIDDATGNVGIGTHTPQNTLNVIGDLNVTGATYLNDINISGVQFNAGDITAENIIATEDISVGGNLSILNSDVDRGAIFKATGDNNRIGEILMYNTNLSENTMQLFSITPTGTGYSSTNKAGINMYNTDILNDSTNYELFIVRAMGTNYAIYSSKGGTGSLRPIQLSAVAYNDPQLYLNTDGNVGIGTSTPQNKLNVIGDLNVTGATYLNDINISGVQFNAGDVRADGIFYGNGSGLTDIPADGILEEWVDTAGDSMSGDLNMTVGNDILITDAAIKSIADTGDEKAVLSVNSPGSTAVGTTLQSFGTSALQLISYSGTVDIRSSQGSDLLLQKDGGNVGIGTSNPTRPLEIVYDEDDTSPGSLNFPTILIHNENISEDVYAGIEFSSSDTAGGRRAGPTIMSIFTNKTTIGVDGELAFYVRDMTTGGGVKQAMYIEKSGDIGMGTASPTAPLTLLDADDELAIFTSSDADGYIKAGYSASYAILGGDSSGGYIDSSIAPFRIEVANDEKLKILGSGNVGIGDAMGTSNPAYQFHINDSTQPQLIVEDSTSGVEARILADNDRAYMGTKSNHDLRITTNNAAAMTIQADGDIGIGTNSPTQDLTIDGEVNITDTNTLYIGGGEIYWNDTSNQLVIKVS
ncbi:beta strand repeat-containing protein [Nanoarchaeota archaeon]